MTIFLGQIAGSKLTLFFSIFWNLLNSIPLRYIWAQSIYRCYLWSRLKVSFVESEEAREKELPQRGDISIACNLTKVGPQNKPSWLRSPGQEGSVFISPPVYQASAAPVTLPDPRQHFEFNFLYLNPVHSEQSALRPKHEKYLILCSFAGEGLPACHHKI